MLIMFMRTTFGPSRNNDQKPINQGLLTLVRFRQDLKKLEMPVENQIGAGLPIQSQLKDKRNERIKF